MQIKKYMGIFILTLAITACGIQEENINSGTVQATLQVVPQDINRVRFTITGPGMTDIQRTVLVQPGQTITEQFLVPRGPHRLFRVEAFSYVDYLTYEGETSSDITQSFQTLTITPSYVMRYGFYIDDNTSAGYAYDYIDNNSLNLNSINSFISIQPLGIVYEHNMDNSFYIYNIGAKWAVMLGNKTIIAPQWTAYRIDTRDPSLRAVQITSSTTTESTVCGTHFVDDQSEPLRSWIFVQLPGSDNLCYTVDDHTVAFNLSGDNTTPWTDLSFLVHEAWGVYGPTGNLKKVMYTGTIQNNGVLYSCSPADISPQSCQVVLSGLDNISPVNAYGLAITNQDTFVLFNANDNTSTSHTYLYKESTGQVTEYPTFIDKKVYNVIAQGQFFYFDTFDFNAGYELWKMPVDGSNNPVRILSLTSIYDTVTPELKISGERLILYYADATMFEHLISISTDGSNIIEIGLDSTANPCSLIGLTSGNTTSDFVFYNCNSTEACIVRNDNTSRTCLPGFLWHKTPVVYSKTINGGILQKMASVIGYNFSTGELIAYDINNIAVSHSLGNAIGSGNSINRIEHIGGGNILIETSTYDIYYGNSATGVGVRPVATTLNNEMVF